jgi:HAE1 family hydrophobic/amphiphilic exporter-1
MNPFTIPIRRPVATSMVFVGIVLLGLIAWWRMPVELIPNLAGNELTVSFNRPGSEPEVVEREILLPLEGRVSELPLVAETWGEVRGSGGSLRIRFESDANLKVRELELQQVAAEMSRRQPRGTSISVRANDLSFLSQFVMILHGQILRVRLGQLLGGSAGYIVSIHVVGHLASLKRRS